MIPVEIDGQRWRAGFQYSENLTVAAVYCWVDNPRIARGGWMVQGCGDATLHPKDVPHANRLIGRKIALARALTDAGLSVHQRRVFWKGFLAQCRVPGVERQVTEVKSSKKRWIADQLRAKAKRIVAAEPDAWSIEKDAQVQIGSVDGGLVSGWVQCWVYVVTGMESEDERTNTEDRGAGGESTADPAE